VDCNILHAQHTVEQISAQCDLIHSIFTIHIEQCIL